MLQELRVTWGTGTVKSSFSKPQWVGYPMQACWTHCCKGLFFHIICLIQGFLVLPTPNPTVPKCLWKDGGREKVFTYPGYWRPPRNTLHLFIWLLWLMFCGVKPSIKWAVMRALTSSQQCTLTRSPHHAMCGHKRLMLHLAIVKGLSRRGHPHEFLPNHIAPM